jgi:hypothetical protein
MARCQILNPNLKVIKIHVHTYIVIKILIKVLKKNKFPPLPIVCHRSPKKRPCRKQPSRRPLCKSRDHQPLLIDLAFFYSSSSSEGGLGDVIQSLPASKAVKMLFLVVILVLFSLLAIPTPNLALCPGDCLCDNTRLSVNCSDVYLPDMPMTLNPHIKSMRINYAGLERIESNLQFYPDLIVCDLRYNRISSLTPYVFESQAQLSKLLLGHNRINTVYKESLEGLTNLLTLDLSNNKLSHLGPNIFADLHRLGHLDLSANNIGTVHRLAFQVLKNFEKTNKQN